MHIWTPFCWNGSGMLEHMIDICVTLVETDKQISKWLYHFTFLTAVHGSSCWSIDSIFCIVSLFDYSHSSEHKVVYHCSWNLRWCWVSFHGLLVIRISSFMEYLLIICSFFKSWLVILLLICRSSSCIVYSLLSDIRVAKISPYLWFFLSSC